MKRYLLLLLTAWFFGTACSHSAPPGQREVASDAPAKALKVYDQSVPPTNKQVLRALLDSQDVSLSTDPSCSGVGTDPSDGNIGDYISGFLAEENNDKGKNWLEFSTKRDAAQSTEPAWHCNVVIRHVDGEDRWGWGVAFLMKAKDHSVVRTSLRCTGSG